MAAAPGEEDSLWEQWMSAAVYAVRFFGLNTWNKLRWGSEAEGAWSRKALTRSRRSEVNLEMTCTQDEQDAHAPPEPTTYYNAIYELHEGEENNSQNPPFLWEDECNARTNEPVNEEFQDIDQAPRGKKQIVRQNSIITTHEIYKHDLWWSSSQQSVHESESPAQTSHNKIRNSQSPKSKDPGPGWRQTSTDFRAGKIQTSAKCLWSLLCIGLNWDSVLDNSSAEMTFNKDGNPQIRRTF
ncbi:uncharacterized protein [Hemitrygon akajei]|uniref:uncharacterized protein n=1 Tax=Hemitrygon akajei TaxID=2704970 RepID=UPI003BF9D66E